MQKLVSYLLGLFVCFSFSSCFMGEEKIVIREDNSGSYAFNIDMGEMLKMMKSMGGEEKMKKEMAKKVDTIVYLKSIVDTSTQLTADEKAMLKDGWIKVKADNDKDELSFEIKGDFSKLENLDYTRSNMMKAIKKLKVMDKMMDKEGKKEKKEEDGEGDGPLGKNNDDENPFTKGYSFSAVPGKITYKVTDKKKLDENLDSDSAKMMMQMISNMMGDAGIKTSYTLPRPVKNYKGANATLSADKKTISFNVPFKDLMEDPKLMEYEIEY